MQKLLMSIIVYAVEQGWRSEKNEIRFLPYVPSLKQIIMGCLDLIVL